ncbi:MAG: hypothetical protein K0Q55_1741, partial [Verrucomicrobia bacterium]|jgi:hypothetical protein|nr:hypothetical protein [Verrucomicrobiota bacterium]
VGKTRFVSYLRYIILPFICFTATHYQLIRLRNILTPMP